MTALAEELAAESGPSCKLCFYVAHLPADEKADWEGALAEPPARIGHTAVMRVLRKRGIYLSEAAVRRHRANHG